MADGAQEVRTAIQLWAARVAASGSRPAFRYPRDGGFHAMTFGEVDAAAREIAAGLASLGVGRGESVCILSQSRLEWVLSQLGILLAGGVTVPIYGSNTAEQSAFIVKDSGARVIIAEDAAQLEKVVPLLDQIPGLRLVHMADDARLEKPDARGRTQVTLTEVTESIRKRGEAPLTLEAVREAGRTWARAHPEELARRTATIGPGDVFTIIYTSGTTGNPKGVVLTHGNVTSGFTSAARALTILPTDEQLLFLPLAHVLALEILWAPIHLGGLTTFAESIAHLKDNMVAVRPTFLAGVPRVFEKLYTGIQAGAKQGSPLKVKLAAWAFDVGKRYAAAVRAGRSPGAGLAFQHAIADKLVLSKVRAKLGLDRCRFLISGGAPLAAEMAEFFHGIGLLVLEGYGLTETVAAAFVNRLDKYRFGTVGPAIDVIESKIDDDGEILMRGPSVFSRYHNNAAATAEAIDAEGWYHSGDIGVIEDGFLRITDRKKDLIVTAGGKKIAPQALENALKARTRLVSQVMVYGDKRPYCVALVTLSEEAVKRFGGDMAKAAASAEARAAIKADIDGLNSTLASYESIKSFAILPTDFSEASGELTPKLSVKRKVVIERYRSTIDGLYSQKAA